MKKSNSDAIPLKVALSQFFWSIKKLWNFNKKYVVASFIFYILGTIPTVLSTYATSLFNQKLIVGINGQNSYLLLCYPLVLVLLFNVFYGIAGSILSYVSRKVKDKLTSFILKEAAIKAEKIDYASYDSPEYYDKVKNGWSEDGDAIVSSADNVFFSVEQIAGILSYAGILAIIDWKLMIVFVALRIAINPVVNSVNWMRYRLNKKLAQSRREEQYYYNFFSNKEMTAEGRTFSLLEYANVRFISARDKIYKATFTNIIKVKAVSLLGTTIYCLPIALSYIYLSICVYNETVSLANMAMFVSVHVGFIDMVYNTMNNLSGFRSYAEKSRYAHEFMALPTTIFTDDDNSRKQISFNNNGHTFEFVNVSFRYPNTEKNVIDDLSFFVDKNETVSLIGANGAGKTTLICLLMRLYDPTEGHILVDGTDIRDYSAESLYKMFGVLFQDYCNYSVTAQESISLSTDILNEENFNNALVSSTADKIVNGLAKGKDTSLSRTFDSNGTELSTGQNQRIAMARAYYKNAPVIILDEPSASIDPESEAEIINRISMNHGRRNVFLISHRLSTCVISDRILLLQDGKLIGNGNHDTLIKTNTEYKRMFDLQADRYRGKV